MIHLITGCMGSGKTARLIEIADQVPDDRKLILGNAKQEGKFFSAEQIASRNGRVVKCTKVLFSVRQLIYIPEHITDVFIDEGQWTINQTIEFASQHSARGINFYVSLLNRDYTGKHYATYLQWANVAHTIETLYAPCAVTGGQAEYSELLTDTESIRKEDYRAVCWEVFRESKHCLIN